MRLERSKNSIRNMLFGMISAIYNMILPFIVRTVFLYTIGVEFLGLNGLFTSILQVLNLAELGVSSALEYSMYHSIANNDSESICALMRLYKKLYRMIGIIVLCIGLLIIPFLNFLIKDDVPTGINIYLLYFLNLSSTVISYWLFAYRNSVILAHQRNDVVTKVTLGTDTLKYIGQILDLVFWGNYYIYVMITLGSQIVKNIIVAFVSVKMYPEYIPRGNLDKKIVNKIKRNVRDIFTAKLSGVISNYADTLVVSSFLGLTALVIYQNYYYIVGALLGIVMMVSNSLEAGLGNSIITEKEDKNYSIFCMLSMVYIWMGGWAMICMLCLFQPFMVLWAGEDLLLNYNVVICLCIYFFVYCIVRLFGVFKDSAGLWKKDRFRPLVVAFVNLTLNLLTIKRFGLYGVILSTVISFVIVGMPWLLRNLFTTIFSTKRVEVYLLRIMWWVIIVAGVAMLTMKVCKQIHGEGIAAFLMKLFFCVVFPNVLFFLSFRCFAEFKQLIFLIKGGVMRDRFINVRTKKKDEI